MFDTRRRHGFGVLGIEKALTLWQAAATIDVPVGTAAGTEGSLGIADLDPAARAAFGIGEANGAVSRRKAMRVPGIRRGRNLIAGTIATFSLVDTVTASDGTTATQPRKLLQQLDPRTTVAYTLAWTIDDLLFWGISWWRVTDRDSTGYPTAVERIKGDRVNVVQGGPDAGVWIDGTRQADRDLIRFDGLDEGMLTEDGAADVVLLALSLMSGAKRQADDDWSGLVLRLAQGAAELDADAITELLDAWDDARARRSTAYLNRAVDPEKISVSAADRQMSELWQIVSSELARVLNLPPSRIGAPQGSGMTYSNTEADRRDLVDTTLAPYLTVIAQRLSMPDVTPNQHRVAFDLGGYTRGTTTELVQAGQVAIDSGVASRSEVRTKWLGLPADPSITDAPLPTNGGNLA